MLAKDYYWNLPDNKSNKDANVRIGKELVKPPTPSVGKERETAQAQVESTLPKDKEVQWKEIERESQPSTV